MSLAVWWYMSGWKKLAMVMVQKLIASEDFFSIDLLLKTLASPFRQISADSQRGGTLQMKLQVIFDKVFSRFIGLVVRSILILVGAGWLLVQAIAAVATLLIWPFLPLLPVIGLVISLTGWLPWKM